MNQGNESCTLDGLTGAVRREFLLEYFDSTKANVSASNSKLICLCVDLNEFKAINDAHGHLVGDAVLKHFASQLIAATEGVGKVFRYGGDEFVVLFELQQTPVHSAMEKFKKCLEVNVELEGLDISLTASMGGSVFPDDATELESLIHMADQSMYAAKENGEGVVVFNEKVKMKFSREEMVRSSLKDAIKLGKIRLAYQPIYCLKENKLNGFEALARWDDDELGSVSPIEFIGIAERSGLIYDLGLQLITEGLDQLSAWSCSPFDFSGYLSLNVSAIQLRSKGFADELIQRIRGRNIPPGNVAIELTESQNLQSSRVAVHNLKEIGGAGLMIFLDDFGVGYSSLEVLRDFRFDKVKVDRGFTKSIRCPGNPSARLVQAITLMAKSMRLKVVAEGIEDRSQLNFLRSFLCDEGQGYYFSEALSAGEVSILLEDLNQKMRDKAWPNPKTDRLSILQKTRANTRGCINQPLDMYC